MLPSIMAIVLAFLLKELYCIDFNTLLSTINLKSANIFPAYIRLRSIWDIKYFARFYPTKNIDAVVK